jgi:ATP-binding cassette subfamily B protein RaxB
MVNLKFGFGKRLPMILQTEAAECGLACLAMIASYHGHETDLPEMRKRFVISLKGATLERLIDIADQLGMISRPLRIGMGHLSQLQMPAMLHWNLNHFVVIKAVEGNWIHIYDPAMGELKLSKVHVSDQFTGIALELSPGLAFKRKVANPPIQLRQLVGHVVGLKRGLLQILILALALEMLALVAPLLLQWITDEAIVAGDQNLLSMLGMGVIAVGATSALISTVRSWIGIYISTHFNMQWMSNVMSHLLKLPVSYFERRHLGDIVSRFGAVRAIEQGLTSAVIDTVLDGLLAVGTLCMMLVFSPGLTMLTLAAVILYGLLRWGRYGSVRAASANAIMKNAKEQSYFLETIRGVRSIKLFGREGERRSAWMNLWVNATNANLMSQRLQLLFDTSWALLSTFERAGVFWFGAAAVINHQMSLGMLFAFLSYKDQFSDRINKLIDRVIEFKMLSIHGERLADIVLAEPEESREYRKHDLPDQVDMVFERLSFRYSTEDAFIINQAHLHIRPGECVAITGPSGSGKTTCLKLMLGILRPTSGKISVSGLSIKQMGLQGYRSLIATVMQDDNLFAGSLYDNICFLDPKPDEAWMYECAKAAAIHGEIIAMPMGYQTLVGDMGTVLSGGQKQRVFLARALYRRPKILFLDEATSHLDLENEEKINKAIAGLRITRIMIAHRPQTIAIADRVISLEKGKFVQVHPPIPHSEARPPTTISLAAGSG